MKPLVWIAGAEGMLGRELAALLQKEGAAFVKSGREVDITDCAAVLEYARAHKPPFIVNCAAYTAVDKAEDEPELCRHINVNGAANLARAAYETRSKIIHISTDYVFDGNSRRAYTEEDDTAPCGVYGKTKQDGELALMQNTPHFYIIRTAWLYGRHGKNFVSTMLKLMNEKPEIKVVDDQRGSPTWTFDLAAVIAEIIKADTRGRKTPYGIYHFTDKGDISWHDFAREIYAAGRITGLVYNECTVLPCTTAEYPTKAKRPVYSVLDKTKIQTALEIDIPLWDKSLLQFLRQLTEEI